MFSLIDRLSNNNKLWVRSKNCKNLMLVMYLINNNGILVVSNNVNDNIMMIMMMIITLLLLLLVYNVICQNTQDGWDMWHDNRITDISSIPACRAISLLKGKDTLESSDNNEFKSVVVIGDVHGEYDGLLENLYNANITKDTSTCDWNEATKRTLLVQVGDIVDRGERSYDCYFCLKHLQQTATNSNKVVRILGNHCIWWLEQSFHMKNANEPIEKARLVVTDMISSILDGTLKVAHSMYYKSIPLLISHAGLRNEMIKYINLTDIDLISTYINNKLLEVIDKCKDGNIKCSFKHELFMAGRERGGTNIGGLTWTDFSIFLSQQQESIPIFHQIVGHSIHDRIRVSNFLSVIDVDMGMQYSKRRGFLKINENAKFLAYEKNNNGQWKTRDLSQNVCQ